jgi:hypothetical protein
MPNRELSSEEYAALMTAARKLGYSVDDFECAMAFGAGGVSTTVERWRVIFAEMECEAERILLARKEQAGQDS